MSSDISFQSSVYGLHVLRESKTTWRGPGVTAFIRKKEKRLNAENSECQGNRKADGDRRLLSHDLFLELSFHIV